MVGTSPHSGRPRLQPKTPQLLRAAECCGSNGGTPKVTSTCWKWGCDRVWGKGSLQLSRGACSCSQGFCPQLLTRRSPRLHPEARSSALSYPHQGAQGTRPTSQPARGCRGSWDTKPSALTPSSSRQTRTNSSSSLQPSSRVVTKPQAGAGAQCLDCHPEGLKHSLSEDKLAQTPKNLFFFCKGKTTPKGSLAVTREEWSCPCPSL